MYLPANENEVAAVPDDHRVVRQHREQFAVHAGRVHRLGLAGQQRAVSRLCGPHRLGEPPAPVMIARAARSRQRVEERAQVTRGRGGQRHMRRDPARSVGHVHDLRR